MSMLFSERLTIGLAPAEVTLARSRGVENVVLGGPHVMTCDSTGSSDRGSPTSPRRLASKCTAAKQAT